MNKLNFLRPNIENLNTYLPADKITDDISKVKEDLNDITDSIKRDL